MTGYQDTEPEYRTWIPESREDTGNFPLHRRQKFGEKIRRGR